MSRYLSRERKNRLIRILRRAIHLQDKERFCGMCYHINFEVEADDDDRAYLIAWIDKLLGRHATLEDWVNDKCGTSFSYAEKVLPLSRRPWVNWMIRELKK